MAPENFNNINAFTEQEKNLFFLHFLNLSLGNNVALLINALTFENGLGPEEINKQLDLLELIIEGARYVSGSKLDEILLSGVRPVLFSDSDFPYAKCAMEGHMLLKSGNVTTEQLNKLIARLKTA